MKMTLTRTSDTYVVHELLTTGDSITPCDLPPASDRALSNMYTLQSNILHPNEIAGLDIRASPDGFWRGITQGKGVKSPIIVDAGAILHRGKLAFSHSCYMLIAYIHLSRSLCRIYLYRSELSFQKARYSWRYLRPFPNDPALRKSFPEPPRA